MRGESGD
jgi:hypothetical protein